MDFAATIAFERSARLFCLRAASEEAGRHLMFCTIEDRAEQLLGYVMQGRKPPAEPSPEKLDAEEQSQEKHRSGSQAGSLIHRRLQADQCFLHQTDEGEEWWVFRSRSDGRAQSPVPQELGKLVRLVGSGQMTVLVEM